jgi:hypothetical protein
MPNKQFRDLPEDYFDESEDIPVANRWILNNTEEEEVPLITDKDYKEEDDDDFDPADFLPEEE